MAKKYDYQEIHPNIKYTSALDDNIFRKLLNDGYRIIDVARDESLRIAKILMEREITNEN